MVHILCERDMKAGAGEFERDRPADALGAAGDQRDFSFAGHCETILQKFSA